jgi:hypothetical protein
MDVSTVNKSAAQPVATQKRTADRETSSVRDQKSTEVEARQPTPVKPGPVVNTQGQVTGRHLNVTA